MILKLKQKRPSFIEKTIFEVAQKWNAGQKIWSEKTMSTHNITNIFIQKKHKMLIDKNI